MAADIETWPRSCRYFVPQIHDAKQANSLRLNGTRYTELSLLHDQPKITCIDLGQSRPVVQQISLPDANYEDILDSRTIAPAMSRVLFVAQKRRYFPHASESFSFIGLDSRVWLQLLHSSMIPTFVIEALHDNNGAFCSHSSYCSDNEAQHDDDPFPPEKICAYHFCVKVGNWASEEYFLYARHDFHTRTNLILVVGTSIERQADRILTQFSVEGFVHLFSVVLLIATCWGRSVEAFRWSADFYTQSLESETGYTARKSPQDVPLKPGQLELGYGIPMTIEAIDLVMYGAERMVKTYAFILEQVHKFHQVSETHTAPTPLTRLEKQLCESIAFHQSQSVSQLSEAANLRRRAESQWTVVNALVSQHDNRLQMEIAKDSREDSKLLRRIAFVTIIFLPATFLATFFSMTFFRTDRDKLFVSKWIWLYFIFTVPLTILLVHQYGWTWRPFKRLASRGRENLTEVPTATTHFQEETRPETRYAIKRGYLRGSVQPPLQSRLQYPGVDSNYEAPHHRPSTLQQRREQMSSTSFPGPG